MRVLAAVSGGADSVAMLLMLGEREDVALTCAHFEHGIRGRDSLDDAAFVRALCARLSVPLIEGAADVPALARARKVGLEQAARDARHAFLRDAKARCGADVVALAHHRGDQAETVLMHIARGAGLRGAAGMTERDGDIWRPLIRMSKPEILAYLAARGEPHREDATNAMPDTPRNRIRHEVLPALERAYPGAEGALARFSDIAQAEDELLAGLAEAFWAEHGTRLACGARLAVVPDVHAAILRRALGLALGACRSHAAISSLERLYRSTGGRLSVTAALTCERTGSHLYLIDKQRTPPRPVPLQDGARLGGVGAVRVSACAPEVVDLGPDAQIVNEAALDGAAFRCRQVGDRFHMLGGPGGRLLSDVMVDRKIDRPLRAVWPLVAVGNEVLWAPGIGVSERAKVGPGTASALRLAFETDH